MDKKTIMENMAKAAYERGVFNGLWLYAENGEIVACLVDDDSATVKRFCRDHRRILLMPENESYPPIELTPEDFEIGRARILGVAVEAKTKF